MTLSPKPLLEPCHVARARDAGQPDRPVVVEEDVERAIGVSDGAVAVGEHQAPLVREQGVAAGCRCLAKCGSAPQTFGTGRRSAHRSGPWPRPERRGSPRSGGRCRPAQFAHR